MHDCGMNSNQECLTKKSHLRFHLVIKQTWVNRLKTHGTICVMVVGSEAVCTYAVLIRKKRRRKKTRFSRRWWMKRILTLFGFLMWHWKHHLILLEFNLEWVRYRNLLFYCRTFCQFFQIVFLHSLLLYKTGSSQTREKSVIKLILYR